MVSFHPFLFSRIFHFTIQSAQKVNANLSLHVDRCIVNHHIHKAITASSLMPIAHRDINYTPNS